MPKITDYLIYGLVRAVPYLMELEGIMFMINGIIDKDLLHGFGGAALYVMGRETDKLVSRTIYLPRESKLVENHINPQ